MKTVSATAFKAQCLKLMDEVAATGEPVVITKHGKPVVQIVPTPTESTPLFGRLRGSVISEGDLLSPLDERWEALDD